MVIIVTGRVSGVDISTTPYPGGKPDSVVKWGNVKIDPFDWETNNKEGEQNYYY